MGQETVLAGLPSQRQGSSFNTMPLTSVPVANPINNNPLSAQGVPSEIYNKVTSALANPNKDAFGSLQAVAPAAANVMSHQAQEGSTGAESPLDMFDPKYAIPGAVVGAGMGAGLAAIYNENGDRIFKFIDKIPGGKLGGEKTSQWFDNWIAGRSETTRNRLNLFFNRMEPDVAEQHLRNRIDNAATKRFGPAGEGIVQHLSGETTAVKDLSTHLEFSSPMREGRFMRGLKHIGRPIARLFGSEGHPPVAGLLNVDEANGVVTLKKALNSAQEEAIKAAFGNASTVDEALQRANQAERALFENAKTAGFSGNYKKFSKQLRGMRSYAKGQAQLIEKYTDYKVLNERLRGYNPLVRGFVKSGYYLKRAFGAESMFPGSKTAANAAEKAAGKVGMAAFGGGLVGLLTFGLAFKEATKGETKKDKAKIAIREILSGTVASLALFELGLDKGRLLGLEKLMGKFAFKSFLGTRFSWVGTAIGIGFGMVGAGIIQSWMNKGFNKIFGKARTKEDAQKESAAMTPQATMAGTAPVPASPQIPTASGAAPLAPVTTQSAKANLTQDTFIPQQQAGKRKEEPSPFQMPPTSVNINDIRRNPIADQQNLMTDQVINNVNKGWDDERLIPAGIGGSEH